MPIEATNGGTGQSSYTSGNILYATSSSALTKLPPPAIPGSRLEYNTTNVAWFNPLQETYLFDDFLSANAANSSGNTIWTGHTTGTGAGINTQKVVDSGHPGVLELNTG